MDITEKLNLYKEVEKILVESGIRNMKNWSKHFKKAVCYYHQDL